MPKLLLSFVLSAILLCQANQAGAQERYLDQVIDSVDVHTYTYASKDGENLDLDIYLPFYDQEESRPVILYVHGGGFSSGTRNGPGTVQFCRRLAERGFVAVSMSYRLTRKGKPTAFSCDCPANDKRNTFQAALEDIQDATSFLINNRESLGIDPQNIILAGSSAGAEAALITAYQPPNCYGLDSGPVSYAGVISMAGAIPDIDKVYKESAIPTLFFHGTCDNKVPYATAPHHYCNPSRPGYLILHGAYTLANRLDELEIPYWLHTTCGGKHELASRPMDIYFDEIVEFCHAFVLNNTAESRHTIIPGNGKACNYEQFSFCAN